MKINNKISIILQNKLAYTRTYTHTYMESEAVCFDRQLRAVSLRQIEVRLHVVGVAAQHLHVLLL